MPPVDRAILAFGIDQIGIIGIDAADKAVAAADRQPIFVDRAAAFADRRTAPRAVVLQAADNPVRLLQAEGHVIKLAKSRGIDVVPIAAAVEAGVEAAIATQQHVPPVARIDPQGVAVGVSSAAEVARKGKAAVIRLKVRNAE